VTRVAEHREGAAPGVIGREGLDELIAELARRGHTVIGPTVRDRAILYEQISSTADLPEGLTAEQGRAAKPKLTLGICGEHGGDPASIAFFGSVPLDYVSCSPYRVPIARVAAAQAR
jgi:hypothetical protein